MIFGSDVIDTPRRAPVAADGDARTRDQVLRNVCSLGPVTASRIADELGLTSTGVRRHLEQLDADGLITVAEVPGRRGRGRPARAYVVTPEGHSRLSTGYDDVATSALEFLADRYGEGAVAEFARERLADLEARYTPVVEAAGEDPQARADALAAALADDGYAASARPVGPTDLGVQLCQGHCPMHAVATRFPQFCEEETEVFGRLLGVHVQRLATLAGGEHVCTTYVPRDPVPLGTPRPRGSASPPGGADPHPHDHPDPTHHRAHGHDEGSAT